MHHTIDRNALITTQNLRVGYNKGKSQELVTFDNLTISLFAGELVCFMGSNGIGKSTLIRTLAGLQEPLQGEIIYKDGKHIQPERRAQTISVVLTDKITAGNLTVQEIISFGRYPYLGWNLKLSDNDEKIIQQAIDQLHLHNIRHKKIQELSDGQLQMVMIARTLAQDTEIILLDEPTAHLDLNNRVEIMNLLRSISHQSRKAILIATHELDLALQTADSIWLAGKNKNVLTGIPEDLVLNGSFDEIFQFKGFDLKTGKIQHTAYRDRSIKLTGRGHEYLWTKNALERNGYRIDATSTGTEVIVVQAGASLKWTLKKENTIDECNTINELLYLL